MELMERKSGEVARAFGIDTKTVYAWTDNDHVAKFYSDEAKGESGQRLYSVQDQIVMNTIWVLRNREGVKDWQTIAEILESGRRDHDNMPASFYTVDGASAVVAYSQAQLAMQERDQALAEVARLRDELKDERERSRQAMKDERDESRQREMDYVRKITELEIKIQSLMDNQSP